MNKELVISLAWGGGIIAVSLAAAVLLSKGYISQDTMIRTVAMNGLMIAYYGNLAPKKVMPSETARQLARFSGWSFVLSGLVYAGFWAFAPLDLAMTIGTGAVAVGLIATLVYGFRLRKQGTLKA